MHDRTIFKNKKSALFRQYDYLLWDCIFFRWNIYVAIIFLTLAYFTFQYSMIISLEEQRLEELFNNDYKIYCENVPRLFPRMTSWSNRDGRLPSTFKKTLKTEKRTLQNLALTLFFILSIAYYKTII